MSIVTRAMSHQPTVSALRVFPNLAFLPLPLLALGLPEPWLATETRLCQWICVGTMINKFYIYSSNFILISYTSYRLFILQILALVVLEGSLSVLESIVFRMPIAGVEKERVRIYCLHRN
jgi:hypothetical protein